jgi:hypothetical protein
MPVIGIGGTSAVSMQTIVDMRARLDELQRQLASGRRATSYAGVGLDRGLTIGLRSQLSAISGYQQSITQVGVRLELMQNQLTQFDKVTQTSKSSIMLSQFALNGASQTRDQLNIKGTLDQLVGMLNTGADGRYLFSGRSVTQVPVDTTDHILDGDGLKAGLRQLISERRQADLGASGLGRVSVASSGGAATSITEDAGVFGFKLVGASSNIAGSTVTGPTGSPAVLDFDLGPANPNPGETVTFTFTLPDGTTRDLTLRATASATPDDDEFTIGADSTVTAGNLQTTLMASLGTMAATELTAASAIAAGNDFFDTDASNPPQRVDGPPFDTATAMIDGTAANTVQWYRRQRHRRSALHGGRSRRHGADGVLRLPRQRACASRLDPEHGDLLGGQLHRDRPERGGAVQRVEGAARPGAAGQRHRAEALRYRGPARRRADRAEQRQGAPPADQLDAGEPVAEHRGRADRGGRGADSGDADQPAGDAADHRAAAAHDAAAIPVIAVVRD